MCMDVGHGEAMKWHHPLINQVAEYGKFDDLAK